MPTRVPRAVRRDAVRPGRFRAALLVAALTAGTVAALTGTAAPASADPTPPPNPSDAQIGAAQQGKDALAAQVGSLTAQLTRIQAQVTALQGVAEAKEQDFAYAQQQLADATAAAAVAKQGVADAQAAVDTARTAFNRSVRANFVSGGVQGGSGALLTAADPDAVLQSTAFQNYVATHQVDGISRLNQATVAKSNADAAARAAVNTQTQATTAAQQALAAAQQAEAAAASQQSALATQQAGVQTQLDTAQATLLGLQNQRAAYDAWKAEQARIAAEKERERQAALLAAQQEAARQAAAAAAAAASHSGSSSSGGSGSSGSSGGSSSGSSGNPTGGSWTAAKGQDAVNRALAYLGTRYSYAAGTYSGPSYGVCAAGTGGWNDCHVYGFDCSGLTLYAWAPYLHMAHKASIQYYAAGDYHPSTSQLLPGDLLFYGGTAATIHHVAMYIGGGMVVQAPQSGDVVKKTSLWAMGSDYYGATRPLT